MRPTDQEKMAIGKIVCDSWFPRGVGNHTRPLQGHTGKHQRQRGETWVRVWVVVSVGRYGQGRVGKLIVG